jgi:hypothetical protein
MTFFGDLVAIPLYSLKKDGHLKQGSTHICPIRFLMLKDLSQLIPGK